MYPNYIPNLTDREETILSVVVESYIEVGMPISSGYIKKNCDLNISPATIRNAMSSLEKKGYLTHLHTSGGRVPTDIGYRYYVNILPEFQSSNNPLSENIEQEIYFPINKIDEKINKLLNY